MTGTHSRIVDEHVDSIAPNNVYDVCQQSYYSIIVASCFFDLGDCTDEKVRVVCCLLFQYLLHSKITHRSSATDRHDEYVASFLRHTMQRWQIVSILSLRPSIREKSLKGAWQ